MLALVTIQVGIGIIHAGNNRLLMTKVARQADARKNPLPGGGFFYQRPGFVAASVVYKTDFAVRMHFFAFYQLFQQRAIVLLSFNIFPTPIKMFSQ